MFKNLRQKIESIMHEKDGAEGQEALKLLLHGLSWLYGAVQVLRRECYRRNWFKSFKLPCKVVAVGNIAVGGTGKTPMTAYLARALLDMEQKVVVIKRGYKGRGGSAPIVVSDGRHILIDSERSGDEAQMLARQLKDVPVLIGADRYQTGVAAISRFQPDVIVLDDGFQHLRLQRDLDLVLLDSAAPLGNGHVLPRGLLREPVEVLKLAGGIVFTRSSTLNTVENKGLGIISRHMPVYSSSHRPYCYYRTRDQHSAPSRDFSRLQNARVTAFSGIVRNEDFHRVITEKGAELASAHVFPDHHPYTGNELKRIAESALDTGSDLLVTTEKDFMRLSPEFEWPLDLMVVGVEIDFGKQSESFRNFLQSRLCRS